MNKIKNVGNKYSIDLYVMTPSLIKGQFGAHTADLVYNVETLLLEVCSPLTLCMSLGSSSRPSYCSSDDNMCRPMQAHYSVAVSCVLGYVGQQHA